MRFILKIILLSSFLVSSLFSNTNIDECKSDLYYANGVMIKDSENKAIEIWEEKVSEMFINNQDAYDKLGKISASYNTSQGFLDDIFESFEQVMSNEWGWSEFSGYFRIYLELKGYQDSVDKHRPDLTKQVKAYKQSIKDGHGVIVVAHSQGNYYTNEAYEELDEWMKDYFHMFGVATPANHVAGYIANDTTAPYVKFHNDIVKVVPTGLTSNRDNPNTEHSSVLSYDAHDFYTSYMTAENTKSDIFNFILEQIQEHSKAPSQWVQDQELQKGTKWYRLTLKHRFDSSITKMDGVLVYPFNDLKKLYYIQGTNPEDISGFVKASCGGTKILDADVDNWENQKENEIYMINNIKKEKIILECLETQYLDPLIKQCKYYSSYKFIYNGLSELEATGTKYNYHYEGGYITNGYYRGGHIVYDDENTISDSNIQESISNTGTFGSFNKSILESSENHIKENWNRDILYPDVNPEGSYILYTNDIILLGNDTFKHITGFAVFGGGTYDNCFIGCFYRLADENWRQKYAHPIARYNGGVGYEIYTNNYQITRYGTIIKVK